MWRTTIPVRTILVPIMVCFLFWTNHTSANSPFSEMVSFGSSWEMESWTNGLAWPSWLASELDIPAATANGLHYGQGCATTGGMRNQARNYLREHTPDDTTLFTFATGVGDYVNLCSGQPVPIETSVENVARSVSQLVEAGGKHFVMPTFSYPDKVMIGGKFPQDHIFALNTAIDEVVPELEQNLGIAIYRPDFYELWIDMMTMPADFGFTNIADPMGSATNIHEYMWWDPGHPTAAAHRLMGHVAFQAMELQLEPDMVLLGNGETVYHESFDQLSRGRPSTSLPDGWVGVTDGAVYTSLTGSSVSKVNASGSLTSVGQSSDPAVGIGVTRSADANEVQLFTQLADGQVNSIRLQFDLEAWGANKGLAAALSEAAFHVVAETDQGNGYEPIIDFGIVTTGAVLEAASRIDGNAPQHRVSFDSGTVPVELADEAKLRIRWIVPADSQTTGVTFGLDNVELTVLGRLQAGDADQDLDFDQLDLVKVQTAAKYLTDQAATWGEGDWNGAPGGDAGNPPAGNGKFDQLDIIAALGAGTYLTGPYAAVRTGGFEGDGQTSVVYNVATGEVSVDAPAGTNLTSINIDSAAGIFTGQAAQNLGGSFDNDADNNIFKATFGSSFGSISLGNVAQAGLSEEFVLSDLSVVGSLAGSGDLRDVDLVYAPEPSSALLFTVGILIGLLHLIRARR